MKFQAQAKRIAADYHYGFLNLRWLEDTIAAALHNEREEAIEECATACEQRAYSLAKGGPHFAVPIYCDIATEIRALAQSPRAG